MENWPENRLRERKEQGFLRQLTLHPENQATAALVFNAEERIDGIIGCLAQAP